MEYNKNGEVIRYKNRDDILRLNLSDAVRENIEEKFNKRVFFDYNGSCKIGTLCGVEVNRKLSEYFYILESDDKEIYVSCFKSLTLL